ncbi:MAG: ribonuclease HII [Weeksellaceae bacterium]
MNTLQPKTKKRKTSQATFEYEKPWWDQNTWVIGVDEVGRGPLAGPVTVGGVCFPLMTESPILTTIESLGIDDSKKLDHEKRAVLAQQIKTYTPYHAVAHTDVEYINQHGIVAALSSAVTQVVRQICSLLSQDRPYILLIDGYKLDQLPYEMQDKQYNIIKGDQLSISIAAASIIAKVDRDQLMEDKSQEYPAYQWQQNKGYGTAIHLQAIREHGVSPYHRLQYVRKYL